MLPICIFYNSTLSWQYKQILIIFYQIYDPGYWSRLLDANLENVAIANALRLEAARGSRATPALSPL